MSGWCDDMPGWCDERYCARDYGQTVDNEGLWWCGECGYETYDWDDLDMA